MTAMVTARPTAGCAVNRAPAIEQFAGILWLSRYSKENLITALSFAAYFDASGKMEHPVLSIGGAVAPVYKWARFERDWCKTLKKEGVTEFHATDFAASKGEYRDWKGDKDRRRRFIRTLSEILKRNSNKIFSASVELEAWESVNKEYFLEECCHSPYALCGFAVVKQVLQWAKRKSHNQIEFIFEEGDAGWGGLKKLSNGIGIDPIQLPKKKAIPCQASDLIAWKSRIAFTNGIRKLDGFMAMQSPTIREFETILAESNSLNNVLVRPGTPGVFSRAALLKTCKDSGIPKRSVGIR